MLQLSLFNDIEEQKNESVGEQVALIVDGNNVLNRAYYASALNPDNIMKSPDGRYTNGVLGFLKMILKYKDELKATHLAVVFDEGRGFRQGLYQEYKGTRGKQPDELKEQFPLLRSILKGIGIPVFSHKQYEADDLIASLARMLESDMKVFTLSNDKDLLQIVSNQVVQIVRDKKTDIYYNTEEFKSKYQGLEPIQIIEIKALMGDSSDNIPGVPGIGEKGAMGLIKAFQTIESLFESMDNLPKEFNRYKKKLEEGKASGVLSKTLTTLKSDICPIEHKDDILYQSKKEHNEYLKEACSELGFQSFLSDLNLGKYKI